MENQNSNGPLHKKMEEDRDDATEQFANSEKASAAVINRGGDARSRNYMEKEDTGSEGPDFNEQSKNADGDTSENAGVFK